MLIKSATYFSEFVRHDNDNVPAPRLSACNRKRSSQYGLLATANGVSVMSVADVGGTSSTLQFYFLMLQVLINPLNFGHG